MFVACGICCLADVSSVSPSSEQTAYPYSSQQHLLKFSNRALTKLLCNCYFSSIVFRNKYIHINFIANLTDLFLQSPLYKRLIQFLRENILENNYRIARNISRGNTKFLESEDTLIHL